jgi:Fe2+ transport system protein FeoA
MLLADAPIGTSFRIVRVLVGKELGKRLADMGFTAGAEGTVIRGSPFRGPMQIRIRGYDVLIRRFEARGIEIEPIETTTTEEVPKYYENLQPRRRRLHGFGKHLNRFPF